MYRRLGDVIDHEALVRQAVDEQRGRPEMLGSQQQVVGEPVALGGGNAAHVHVAGGVVESRHVVDQLPDAHEVGVRARGLQAGLEVGCSQIEPTHDAAHEVVFRCQGQQPVRLGVHLPRLDGDGSMHAGGSQLGLQLTRQVVALQWRLRLAHPRELAGDVSPEVLVGVDHGDVCWAGVFWAGVFWVGVFCVGAFRAGGPGLGVLGLGVGRDRLHGPNSVDGFVPP